MKRLLLVFLTIGMTACFPARDPVPSANGGDQHSDDPAQPGGDPSDSPSSSDDPTRPKGEISGWTCKIYTQDHLDFVNDYDFIFDEKGRVCQHNLHQITYNTDGSVSTDDHIKYIYHYTSDTHIDFYNDFIEGHAPTTSYDLDSEGRIIEQYYSWTDNLLFEYNASGQLTAVKNLYQYEDAEDEEQYGDYEKSTVFAWNTNDDIEEVYQYWEKDGDGVRRDTQLVRYDLNLENPYYDKVIDPLLCAFNGMTFFGLTGKSTRHIPYGIFSREAAGDYYQKIELKLDADRRVVGMTRHLNRWGLFSDYVYEFRYFTPPEPLPEEPIIIN